MAIFTEKQILDTGDLFRPVPMEYRGIVTGLMMGINAAEDKSALPDMIKLAMAMNEKQTA